jgi:hypothetical protein
VQQLPDPDFGRLSLRDASGQFVVGQNRFPPGSLMSATPVSVLTKEWLGCSDGAKNFLLWTDSMYSSQLRWQSYDAGWSLTGNGSPIIDDSQSGFEIQGVFYDPLAANPLALVFFNYNVNQVYVFRTPVPDSIAIPMVLLYPPLVLQDVDAGRVFYTRKGIVLADDKNAALLDFSGRDTGKKLDLGQQSQARLAFDIEGDTFYVFNPEDRRLYVGNTGW